MSLESEVFVRRICWYLQINLCGWW